MVSRNIIRKEEKKKVSNIISESETIKRITRYKLRNETWASGARRQPAYLKKRWRGHLHRYVFNTINYAILTMIMLTNTRELLIKSGKHRKSGQNTVRHRYPVLTARRQQFTHTHTAHHTITIKKQRIFRWPHWSRGQGRGSAAALLKELLVRNPAGAWMPVSCELCVLSGRGLCDGPITRPESPT